MNARVANIGGKGEYIKMKKKLLLITLFILLALTFNAFAATKGRFEEWNVFIPDIKISMDGTVLELKDAKGNKVEPIQYKGTTYLPLRCLANTIGKEVNLNPETGDISLNTPDSLESLEIKQIDYPDGSKYVGQVSNDKREGNGTFYFPKNDSMNRSKFEGNWITNCAIGTGILTFKDSSYIFAKGWILEDIMTKNPLTSTVGKVIWKMDDTTTYYGELNNGLMSGNGLLETGNTEYLGDFKAGDMDGLGMLISPDGSQMFGEFKNNEIKKTIYENNLSLSSVTNMKNSGTQSIATPNELKAYLDKHYSYLDTSLGRTNFTFTISENSNVITAYDYWIQVNYDFSFFYDLKYSIKYTSDQKIQVKQELKDFQEKLAKDVISKMPNKKLCGGYLRSWYRYPNLRLDLQVLRYYSWENYDEPNYLVDIMKTYESTKPSTFRWDSLSDDEL